MTINGKPYNVGGLYGQKQKAYLLNQWLDGLTANDSDFLLNLIGSLPLYPISTGSLPPMSGHLTDNNLQENADIFFESSYLL
ncbi:hypothetical protein CS542_03040 [Pedobacter sp. IW39]|nr:hypothetical protein CS542_03040 [Pedobacter sp. IW39]